LDYHRNANQTSDWSGIVAVNASLGGLGAGIPNPFDTTPFFDTLRAPVFGKPRLKFGFFVLIYYG
jgi:hypothetical protein